MLSGMCSEAGSLARHGEAKKSFLFYTTPGSGNYVIFFIFDCRTGSQSSLVCGVVACCSYQNIHSGGNDSGIVGAALLSSQRRSAYL